MTPLEIIKAQLENQWFPKEKQADIDYKKMGGGRGSTGSRDEMFYQASVAQDNPQLKDPAKLREAIDVVASGGNKLSDGTPLNVSLATQRAYDRAYLSTTTRPLVTQGVRANAAQAEMPVLDKYINQGRSPYGTTVFGKSPQQIKDTLDLKNKDAQNRLGDYIASDVLSFDKAALQTRIAGTESGVTIIDEVMKKAKQTIDARYPMLSDSARKRALETVNKALTEALQARNRYGLRASSAAGNRSINDNDQNQGEVPPEGTIWMVRPDGKKVPVHTDNIDIAKSKYNFKEVE